MAMTLITWNVNGLRPRHAMNQFLPVFRHNPDIVCIQEAKTEKEKIPAELKKLHGYFLFCAPVPEGSFTEVMLFSRHRPLSLRYGFEAGAPDGEGRLIIAEFPEFILLNVYVPLGNGPVDTLEHKLAFCDALLSGAAELQKACRPVIICGDFSIAHTDNDVESVKKHASRQVSTSPAEREKIDILIRSGFSDVLRMFRKGKGSYTWWPNGFKAPERHIGRRLDYYFVNDPAKQMVIGTEILSGVEGSDHCPVTLEIRSPSA
jgi:exodeoxyribonuclease-3